APSCCASLATENAMEASVSTPVTRIRLPSRMPMSVSHSQSAVDGDHGPGDVGGVLARHEADDARDLLGARLAPEGDVLDDRLLVEAGRHVGVDEPGRDHVDGDAARTVLARQRAGEADETGLGGRVVGL